MEKNWLEWIVFGVSSVLVLGVIGYLSYDAITSSGGEARLEIRLGKAEKRGQHFAVPVSVSNRGKAAAETVLAEVVLETPDGSRQRSHLQIQLVPGHSHRKGWVMFDSDPAQAARLTARVLGFESP